MSSRIAKTLRAVCAGLLLSASASHAADDSVNYVAVEVRQGAVFIKGNRVTRDGTLSEYQAILGKPDRVTHLDNTIYTYDKLGIVLYQHPGENTVLSFSLRFLKSKHAFSPTNSFRGVFIVDNQVLRPGLPQSALRGLGGVQFDSDDKTLKLPVTVVRNEGVILIFEHLSSREQIEGVSISWPTKGEPDGTANGSQREGNGVKY